MVIASYISIALILALVVFLGLTKYNQCNKKTLIAKIAVGVLGLCYLVLFVSKPSYLYSIIGLSNPVLSKSMTVVVELLFWFSIACGLIVILAPFYPQIQATKYLIKFFVLPVSFLDCVLFYYLMHGVVGANAFSTVDYRVIFGAGFVSLMLGFSVVYTLPSLKELPKRREILDLILAFIGIIIVTMPVFIPQALFGTTKQYALTGFTMYHRITLYLLFAIPMLLFFLLVNQPLYIKRFVLIYTTLGGMIVFMLIRFTVSDLLANPYNWPFHLCNTAMFILPLTLVFKMKKLFYFTLFINVLGAFFALIWPNYTGQLSLTSTTFIAHLQGHYTPFFVPVLCVALGVFERPKLKQFIYSMAAFTGYFVFVVFINAWFTNFASVDYFFLNSDFIVNKLGGWAKDTRKTTVSFSINNLNFVFYPVYQVVFFLVYVALGVGMWFLYSLCFVAADNLAGAVSINKKLKLDSYALKSSKNKNTEPQLQGGSLIELKDFSKKYNNAENYAVKDANLTIDQGCIFGFLGPNGAGKSTIIKSIVGIQTPTSGSITVCGYDVVKQSMQAKSNIGFVPDHYALYEHLTGREYVNYIADIYGVTKPDRDIRINRTLDDFELSYAFDKQIRTYSHGMKQKIAIMSALVHNPKVWILDEPLTGLDPSSIFQVKETMKRHAKEGNIVFFSSHIIDVVEKLCDKIAIIRRGEILVSTDTSEILSSGSLESYYIDKVGIKGAER